MDEQTALWNGSAEYVLRFLDGFQGRLGIGAHAEKRRCGCMLVCLHSHPGAIIEITGNMTCLGLDSRHARNGVYIRFKRLIKVIDGKSTCHRADGCVEPWWNHWIAGASKSCQRRGLFVSLGSFSQCSEKSTASRCQSLRWCVFSSLF